MFTFQRLVKPLNGLVTKYNYQQVRNLSVHEYNSMQLLRQYGVNVPEGDVAETPRQVFDIASDLKRRFNSDIVIKAQVLAGGRGKGQFSPSGLNSGVHIVFSPEEAQDVASQMLGQRLVTKQTGKNGLPCNKVYVCQRLYSRREFYLAFTLDRSSVGPILIGSSRGGVNIEEVAQQDPDLIKRLPIKTVCVSGGGSSFNTASFAPKLELDAVERFLTDMGFSKVGVKDAALQIKHIFQLFCDKDCTLLEINPFCELSDGKIYCLDGKLQFDYNALYRQEQVSNSFIDNTQVDPREIVATKHGLNYVGLDGNIGCLVNGAGLAMATMDIIKHYGGAPANFLDVGGGATKNQVTEAFRLITSDQNVKAIFVNIFGGIMRCDVIAEGVAEAAEKLNLKIPIVVRLQGTRMDDAKAILASARVKIIPSDQLDEAANMAVKLAQIVEIAHKAELQVNFELPL